jgi:uncharacterized membrane protein (UPF0127 family)
VDLLLDKRTRDAVHRHRLSPRTPAATGRRSVARAGRTRAVAVAALALTLSSAAAAAGATPRAPRGTLAAPGAALPCGFRDDETLTIDGQKIDAELANTTASRERGLSGRPCIEADETMLFVFSTPGEYGFWMKQMNVPLDIVWLSSSGSVVKIERKLAPSSYPEVFTNTTPAQYVLELGAGRAASLGLKIGSEVHV